MTSKAKALQRLPDADSYPETWPWARLDDVCEGVIDCPHSTPELTSVGPLVARSQDIRSGVFDLEGAAHVSEATYSERVMRAQPCRGDLLYSREGTYFGIAAEVPEGARICLGQRMVLIRPRRSQVNFRYLKYWLNSPGVASYLHGFRDGSVAERLNLPTIRGLPVIVPPLPEQDRIADMLGSLDERIALSWRMIRALESIACAIFKSWFIDFDPVRSNMAGKQDSRIAMKPFPAAIFPSAMVSTFGIEHPEGWRCGELADLASERTQRVGDHGVHAVVLSAVSSGQLVRSDDHFNKRVYSKDLSKYKRVLHHELAYNPSRVNIGSIGMLQEDVLGAVSPVYVVFTPREGYAHFVDFFMRDRSTRSWIGQLSSGSVRQSLAYRDLATIPVVIPSPEAVAAFGEVVASVRASSKLSEAQASTLCGIRDALLPKLMRGEVGIP